MQCYKHLESTLKKQFFSVSFLFQSRRKPTDTSRANMTTSREEHFISYFSVCLSVCENWMQTSALHCARHWKGVTAAKGRSSPSLGTISENKDLGVFSISLSSDLLVPGGPANKPLRSSTHFISPSLWGGRRPPSPSCADLRYCPPRGGHLWSSRLRGLQMRGLRAAVCQQPDFVKLSGPRFANTCQSSQFSFIHARRQ